MGHCCLQVHVQCKRGKQFQHKVSTRLACRHTSPLQSHYNHFGSCIFSKIGPTYVVQATRVPYTKCCCIYLLGITRLHRELDSRAPAVSPAAYSTNLTKLLIVHHYCPSRSPSSKTTSVHSIQGPSATPSATSRRGHHQRAAHIL